jgi:hypothetical protein
VAKGLLDIRFISTQDQVVMEVSQNPFLVMEVGGVSMQSQLDPVVIEGGCCSMESYHNQYHENLECLSIMI